MPDSFGTLRALDGETDFYSLPALAEVMGADLDAMPASLKVLLENLLRREDGVTVTAADVAALACWPKPVALGR